MLGKSVPKKRLPEGWLLSTSGSAPRLEQPLKIERVFVGGDEHKTV
jgi:hypothetical protein